MTCQFWMTAGLFTAAVLFLTVDVPAASRSNRSQQKAMQQLRQQQAQQYEADQKAAAQRVAAIAAEHRRLFEIHQKASKARNEKIDAEREAARERRLAEQRTKVATPVKDTKPKP